MLRDLQSTKAETAFEGEEENRKSTAKGKRRSLKLYESQYTDRSAREAIDALGTEMVTKGVQFL